MKNRLSVYLDPALSRSLAEYAQRRSKSKSLVAEAAIGSFLSPDAAERQEAAMTRRLDQLVRRTERLERDVGIAAETIALFIRFWLLATPQLPDQTQPAIRAKGIERYERFVTALGKRLSQGPSFLREVSLDVEPAGYNRPRSEQGDAPSRS
jgi:hypothetical protein